MHPDYGDFLAVLRDLSLAPPFAELWGMEVPIRDFRATEPTG